MTIGQKKTAIVHVLSKLVNCHFCHVTYVTIRMGVEIHEHKSLKRPLFRYNLVLNVYICIKKVELKVLYFGVSRDQTNKDEEDLDVRENLTAGELKKKLMDMYPKLEDIQSFALAVNETYAEDSLMLKEGDTIAIIPPVSGG